MKLLSILIIKVYRIIYSVIRLKFPAYLLALLYVTALHMMAIYGFALLGRELAPTQVIISLFSTRYVYLLALVLLGINYYVTPAFKSIIVENKGQSNNALVFLYTAIDLVFLLFAFLMQG